MIFEGAIWRQVVSAVLAVLLIGFFVYYMIKEQWPWESFIKKVEPEPVKKVKKAVKKKE